MAAIKIKGCGYCSKSKGCKIKKSFRDLAASNDSYTEVETFCEYLNSKTTHKSLNVFELKCPFVDRKYKSGDNVKVTVGVQRYIKTTLWDCDISYGDNDPCDNCSIENCNSGVVTFKNTRYEKYIEVEGMVVNLMRNDKWVIKLSEDEYKRLSLLCNELDLKFFEEVSEKIDPEQCFYMVLISKEKYITKINYEN
jgi:hypothetical protein